MKFTPLEAKEYADKGKLEEWIDAFLRSERNPNIEMAEGLKKSKRYWHGPIDFPLNKLRRICGLEEGMEYPETLENWDARINSIIKDVNYGEIMPPFIIKYSDGKYRLADGNHRLGAFEKMGIENYPALVWCDSEEDFERLKEAL